MQLLIQRGQRKSKLTGRPDFRPLGQVQALGRRACAHAPFEHNRSRLCVTDEDHFVLSFRVRSQHPVSGFAFGNKEIL
jgi:hypothetical protein